MKPENPLGDSGPLLVRALDLVVSACPGLVLERESQVTVVTHVTAALFLILLAIGQCYSLLISPPIPGGREGGLAPLGIQEGLGNQVLLSPHCPNPLRTEQGW